MLCESPVFLLRARITSSHADSDSYLHRSCGKLILLEKCSQKRGAVQKLQPRAQQRQQETLAARGHIQRFTIKTCHYSNPVSASILSTD